MRHPRLRSFTLVELLVVMSVIAILAGLTLNAMGNAQKSAGKSRATAEIAAFTAALERYKIDNGNYPGTAAIGVQPSGTGSIYDGDPTQIEYKNNAGTLYTALSGKPDFTTLATGPIYMEFKRNQVVTNTTPNYVKDPFGNAYGFVSSVSLNAADPTATNNVIFNAGFFDLWSTSAQNGTGNQTNTAVWISNWGSQ
jgi:prepilin-type N-terminal cleavage/methylation domain-containing protein